jgi:hypothetical protein
MAVALFCAMLTPCVLGELDVSKCGKLTQVCCNIAADAIDCSEGTCLTETGAIGDTTNGECKPCGADGQPCCSPVGGLLPNPQNICNKGFTCNQKANVCKAAPPPVCGTKGQYCCIAPDDRSQTCEKGLSCVRKPSGPRVGTCTKKSTCGNSGQKPCKGRRMFFPFLDLLFQEFPACGSCLPHSWTMFCTCSSPLPHSHGIH